MKTTKKVCSIVRCNVVYNRTIFLLVWNIVRRYTMDANDRCHRIVLDSRVYSHEFHFEHDKSMEIVRIMLTRMCKDRTVVALEFVTQLADDDNAEPGAMAEEEIEYYSN